MNESFVIKLIMILSCFNEFIEQFKIIFLACEKRIPSGNRIACINIYKPKYQAPLKIHIFPANTYEVAYHMINNDSTQALSKNSRKAQCFMCFELRLYPYFHLNLNSYSLLHLCFMKILSIYQYTKRTAQGNIELNKKSFEK